MSVLHHTFSTRPLIDGSGALAELRRLDPAYEKPDCESYAGRREVAVANARRAVEAEKTAGRQLADPATRVHLLVEHLDSLAAGSISHPTGS